MKQILRAIRERMLRGVARKSDLDRFYDQFAGLIQIQNAMSGRPVLRPLRGWAISPDAITWVLAELQGRNTPTVVEFGSGQSTVIFAAALQHLGGRLISVEHDTEFRAGIQKQVAACGLDSFVQFVDAPLADSSDENSIKSYDLGGLPVDEIDVALVDGPPILNGPHTRLIPLRWAVKNLKNDGVIFLDDAARISEKECISMLCSEVSGLKIDSRSAEKGLVEIRRSRS